MPTLPISIDGFNDLVKVMSGKKAGRVTIGHTKCCIEKKKTFVKLSGLTTEQLQEIAKETAFVPDDAYTLLKLAGPNLMQLYANTICEDGMYRADSKRPVYAHVQDGYVTIYQMKV